MTFLHIMAPYSTRPYHTIKFLKENFPQYEHKFLIMATRDFVIDRNPRLLAFPDLIYEPKLQKRKCSKYDRIEFLSKLMDSADRIVWHSLITLHGKLFLPMSAQRKNLKKSVWIKYPQDNDYSSKRTGSLKRRFVQDRQYRARKSMRCIGVTFGVDREKAKKLYGDDKQYIELTLPFWKSHIDALKAEMCKETESRGSIIVGFNGRPSNDHLKIVNVLKEYSDGNLIFPMNYSMLYEYGLSNSSAYVGRVRRTAKATLSKPPVILSKGGVSEEDYFKLLNSVSAGVFGGNIPLFPDQLLYLFALGKKVYIPEASWIYSMLEKMGFVVYGYKFSVQIDDFTEFFAMPDEIRENNRQLAMTILDEKNIVKKWTDFFNVVTETV